MLGFLRMREELSDYWRVFEVGIELLNGFEKEKKELQDTWRCQQLCLAAVSIQIFAPIRAVILGARLRAPRLITKSP